MADVNRLFNSLVFLTAAEAIYRLVLIALIVGLSRSVSVESFGIYGFGVAIGLILAALSDVGLSNLVVRDASTKEGVGRDYLRWVLPSRLLLTLTVFFLFAGLSLMVDYAADYRMILWLLAGYALLESITTFFGAFLRARDDIQPIINGKLIATVTAAVAGGLTLLFDRGLMGFSAALLFSQAASAAYLLVYLRPSRAFLPSLQRLWDAIRESIFFVLTSYSYLLILRSDMLLIHHLRSDVELGLYNATYTIVAPAFIMASLLSVVLYRSIALAANQQRGRGTNAVVMKYSLIFSLAVVLVLIFAAEPLLTMIFGSEYAAASKTLQLLAAIIPFIFLNTVLIIALEARGLQRTISLVVGGAAITNILLNLLFIPQFGLNAAALSTLVAEAIIFTMLWRALHKSSDYLDLGSSGLLKSLTVAVLVALILIPTNSVLALAAALLVLYPSLIFLFRIPRKDEWNLLKQVRVLKPILLRIENIPGFIRLLG